MVRTGIESKSFLLKIHPRSIPENPLIMIEQTRLRLQNNGVPDSDHYMKTLVAASISEDNYFNNLLGNNIARIAKDLRDTHSKNAETGDRTTPVDDMLSTFEELKKADNTTQAQMKLRKRHS